MHRYRSQSSVGLKAGTPYHQLGHLIGVAAVITRLIEIVGHGDKDAIKEMAGLILKNALDDIEKNTSDATPEQQREIKEQATAAANQILAPLTKLETVQ